MKVETLVVKTIPAGEAFICDGTVYLRTDFNEFTAVSLEDGSLERIREDAYVVPLFDAHIRLS